MLELEGRSEIVWQIVHKIVIVSLPKIDSEKDFNFFVKNALIIAHEIVREIVHEIAPKSIPKCRQVPWNGSNDNRASFTLEPLMWPNYCLILLIIKCWIYNQDKTEIAGYVMSLWLKSRLFMDVP